MFSNINTLTIPNGEVVKITDENGSILWEVPVISSYKNWIEYGIDENKTLLNGKGYVDNTRLSSSGATKTQNYVLTTGYIPATKSAIVRIAGTTWKAVQASYNYVCAYDSSFNFISAVNSNGYYGGGTVGGDSNVATVTLLDDSSIAYIRVSIYHKDVDISGLIVTVNEEIA